MSTDRFAGKVAVVTGGASGIGAAIVRRLHAEGGSAMIADRDSEKGEELAAELGERTRFLATDVTDPDAVTHLMAETVYLFGGIDILFNNAGVGCYGETPDLAIDDWRRVLTVNLDAAFFGCRAAIPHMRGRGGGAIVNTASVSGVLADYGFTAYNAAKAGLINYTRSVALDHACHNIRANSISPGPTDTPLTAGMAAMPGLREEWVDAIPLKRVAQPEEVAAVALFLASDDASYVTGAAIPVDGGLLSHTGQPDLRRHRTPAA